MNLLFDAGGEVEFGEDLGGLGVFEADREQGHVLSRVQSCVLEETSTAYNT